MTNSYVGEWTKEEVLELYQQELGKFYVQALELPGPGEEESQVVLASDRFLAKLLAKQYSDPGVRALCGRRVVKPASSGEYGLVLDVRDISAEKMEEYLDEIASGAEYNDEPKRLTLSQALRDSDAVGKYGFPPEFMRAVENVAADRPVQAVAMLKRAFAARGCTNVTISVGNYTRSAKRAQATIRALVKGMPAVDPSYVEVVGLRMFLHYAPEGVAQWCVYGNLSEAVSIRDMYIAAHEKGPAAAVLLAGVETEVLDITVWNARDNTCFNPSLVEHATLEGIDPLEDYEIEHNRGALTAEQRVRLGELAERIQPVVSNGKVVASAVQVTGRFALLCQHVITKLAGQVAGIGEAAFSPQRQIATDLWVVESQRVMAGAWPLRQAQTGEMAVFCYATAEGMESTCPVPVVSVDGRTVVTREPPEARPGMSGCALVALSDMALLGVYRGQSAYKSIATVFSAEHFAELGELGVARSVDVADDDAYGDVVVQQLGKRGYAAVLKGVFSSMVPLLVDGEHTAVALCMATSTSLGQKVYYVAPNPPDDGVYRFADGRAPAFDRADQGRCYTEGAQGSYIVPVMRRPKVDEKVILLGVGVNGAYVTRPSTVVRVGVGGERFAVAKVEEESPLSGCVVLAWSDACVLGQVVCLEKRRKDGASVLACAGSYVPPAADAGGEIVAYLAEALRDVVTPAIWQRDVLVRVFTHPDGKDEVMKYACVGDAHAKSYAARALMQRGVPHSWWTQITSKTLSNKSWIKVYERLHLARLIRHSGGSIPPTEGSKYGADMVEALIGMTITFEGVAAADRLCEFFGAATVPSDMAERISKAMTQRLVVGAAALSVPVSPVDRLSDPWVRASWHGTQAGSASVGIDMAAELEKLRSRSASPPSACSSPEMVRSPVLSSGRESLRRTLSVVGLRDSRRGSDVSSVAPL